MSHEKSSPSTQQKGCFFSVFSVCWGVGGTFEEVRDSGKLS